MAVLRVFVILSALFALAYAAPNPGFFGGKHEHHTIHVPYNVHTIHHHHVQKVPIYKEIIKEIPVVKHVPIIKEVHVPVHVHDHHTHHDIHHDHHDIHDHHDDWSSSGWY